MQCPDASMRQLPNTHGRGSPPVRGADTLSVSPEVSRCERTPRTGLQVVFKRERVGLSRELERHCKTPWTIARCVDRTPGVMRSESLLHIPSNADVRAAVTYRANDVDETFDG